MFWVRNPSLSGYQLFSANRNLSILSERHRSTCSVYNQFKFLVSFFGILRCEVNLTKMTKNWFPLESNPDVMNTYMGRLGLNTVDYRFVDVLSTEDWALDMVPKPVLAVLMLFPLGRAEEEFRIQQSSEIAANGQTVSPNIFYMKQTIGNACGTIGLLHAAGNARKVVPNLVLADSHLDRLLSTTETLEPEAVAQHLEEDTTLEEVHEEAATQGQTAATDDVDTHFVCFVHLDNCLYELDGRKDSPINHGPSSQETLLADACVAVRRFMDRQPTETRFTIVALAAAGDEEYA